MRSAPMENKPKPKKVLRLPQCPSVSSVVKNFRTRNPNAVAVVNAKRPYGKQAENKKVLRLPQCPSVSSVVKNFCRASRKANKKRIARRVNPWQSAARFLRQKFECGSKASHLQAALLVCSRSAFVTAEAPPAYPRMTASARQHSQASTTFAEASRQFVIRRQPTGNRRATASSFAYSEKQARGGGRNARATSRACAHVWKFPPVDRLRASPVPCWLCRNHSANYGNAHVSLNPLSPTLLRFATEKQDSLVHILWTICLPCGTPRKSQMQIPSHPCDRAAFTN